MPKVDRVRITLELSQEFIKLLDFNYGLNRLGNHHDMPKRHDPAQVLVVVVRNEARGQEPELTHADTPIEWRTEIEPVPEERRWRDAETSEWHATGGG